MLELFFLVVASGEIRTDKVMEKSQEKAYQEKGYSFTVRARKTHTTKNRKKSLIHLFFLNYLNKQRNNTRDTHNLRSLNQEISIKKNTVLPFTQDPVHKHTLTIDK